MILPREVTRDAITSTGEVPTKIRISPPPSIPLLDRVTIASVCGLSAEDSSVPCSVR
jgi:hypothetical protein